LRKRVYYGYLIVAAGFFVSVATWGTLYSFGIFFKPVLEEFGWTRAMTTGAYSLAVIVSGAGNIIIGKLTDRFSPRLVISIFGLLVSAGYVLMSRLSTLWEFYFYYAILLGLGASVNFVPFASAISRWFIKRRGLMVGILISGIGAGTFIMPPFANWLIITYSWRTSYLVVGLVALLIILGSAQFVRRDPREMGLKPYGEDESIVGTQFKPKSLSVSQAMAKRQFWIISGMYFCWGFAIQVIIVHIVPHLTDLKVATSQAVVVLALIGGLSVLGRIGLGSIADRIGGRTACIIGFMLLSASLLWLQMANQLWMFYSFALIFSLGYGGVIAVEPLLLSNLFGIDSLGAIMGMVMFFDTIGEGIGPLFAGWLFDATQDYRLAFAFCAILCIAAVFFSIALNPLTQNQKQRTLL
jgi:MFS transporter, OFA family, oxalate/formate antiporter